MAHAKYGHIIVYPSGRGQPARPVLAHLADLHRTMSIAATSALLLAILAPSAQDTITFGVSPQSIEAGQSVTVRWETPPGSHVFLTGVGRLPASGSVSLTPSTSSTVSLIVERGGATTVRTADISVHGPKGEFPTVDDTRFRFPVSCDAPASEARVALLDRIHKQLEHALQVSPQEFATRAGEVSFVTLPAYHAVEGTPARRIRARRAAFIVAVGLPVPATSFTPCTIRTMVEYRRAGEETWRLEGDQQLYITEANWLKEVLRR